MFPGRLPDGRSLGFPSNSPSPAVTLANQGIKQMAFLNGATNGFTNGDASHKSKPRSIDDNVLKSASLEALQGTEQRKIMDIVDRLRRTG